MSNEIWARIEFRLLDRLYYPPLQRVRDRLKNRLYDPTLQRMRNRKVEVLHNVKFFTGCEQNEN